MSSVQLVSTAINGNGSIDIEASVLDESGLPLSGHSLSCWIQSACGLVEDLIPGWAESYSWLNIAKKLNVDPIGFPGTPSPSLFLPKYCSNAGYPSYVRSS